MQSSWIWLGFCNFVSMQNMSFTRLEGGFDSVLLAESYTISMKLRFKSIRMNFLYTQEWSTLESWCFELLWIPYWIIFTFFIVIWIWVIIILFKRIFRQFLRIFRSLIFRCKNSLKHFWFITVNFCSLSFLDLEKTCIRQKMDHK